MTDPEICAAVRQHYGLAVRAVERIDRGSAALFKLYGSEGIVVRLEAAAGTHAAESRYLADAGAAAVAFGAHPAARLHHFAGTVAHLLVGHFARQRANRFFGLFFSVRSVNGK